MHYPELISDHSFFCIILIVKRISCKFVDYPPQLSKSWRYLAEWQIPCTEIRRLGGHSGLYPIEAKSADVAESTHLSHSQRHGMPSVCVSFVYVIWFRSVNNPLDVLQFRTPTQQTQGYLMYNQWKYSIEK